MPADVFLRENHIAVNSYLEYASRAFDQVDVGIGVYSFDLSHQTGGPWSVVSDPAILDTDLHAPSDSP